MKTSNTHTLQKLTKKHNLTGFTLVELIVVITILVILGTIAFTSLGSFSSNARDSSRSSDLSNLAKGLDIAYIKTSSYPTPDNVFSVTYSGGVLWTQGTLGTETINIIAGGGTKLSKKPTDPLSNKEYTYSKLGQGNAYQIKTDWEGDSISYNSPYNPLSINQVYSAAGLPTLTYIKGNYNNLVAKTQTGSSICLLALPSIISNTGSSATPTIALETTNLLSGSLLTSGGNLTGTPFKSSLTGSTTPVVYCSGALPTTSTEKQTFATALASSYSGTTLATSSVVKPFIAALTTGDNATLISLGGGVVSGSLGGKIITIPESSLTTYATGGIIDSYYSGAIHYQTHTFKTIGASSFTVIATGLNIECIIVGGGGSGGFGYSGAPGGGGGGGGFSMFSTGITVAAYPVIVGGGGVAPIANGSMGNQGGSSSFSGITSVGGGGGGTNSSYNPIAGGNGSSGGGGFGAAFAGVSGGGSGVGGQGYAGGNAASGGGGGAGAGGGGGAGGIGGAGVGVSTSSIGGGGGIGIQSTISNTPVYYGGGGGGAGNSYGLGDAGGGNAGNFGSSGSLNTGGGGGGGYGGAGIGGSGIVIVRYQIP